LPAGLLAGPAGNELVWHELADLPAEEGAEKSLGFAGAFAGTHNGALIAAGGANFPEGLPWDAGSPPKIYYDSIYVLTEEGGSWTKASTPLPGLLGYGGAVTHPDLGLICMGGEWKERPVDGKQTMHRSDRVFALTWTGSDVAVNRDFPPLPRATTACAAALVGDTIYLMGGDSGDGPADHFWALNLKPADGETMSWQILQSWPGAPRVLAVAAAQSDGVSDSLYLFSGRNPGKTDVDLLTDAYRYTARDGWRQLDDIEVDGGAGRCIMGAVAAPYGNAHIILIGGAPGLLFRRLAYEFPAGIAAAKAAGDTAAEAKLEAEKLGILNDHPGFSRDVLAFHTVTGTWTKLGELQDGAEAPVTTGAAVWNGRIVVPTGEMSPGIRTPQTLSLSISHARSFGTVNYAVLIAYLIAIVLNGLYFSRKMKTTDDFFKAGGRIPWWAAGLSIFGTQLSAITFIAIPGKVFASDWRLYIGQLAILIVAPFIIFLFLPFYRRLNVTTAYEYLEMRFNVFVRCFGSVMFMFLQFARIGIVLYLPSIALSIVTGMSVDLCILMMGVLCIVYTVTGGMEAVVWTDVTQVVILTGGALLCLIMIPLEVPGGWNAMIEVADADNKFRLLDFRWDLATTAFAVVLLGSLCGNLISYGTDQAVIQRYLTTKDEKSAARSIWTNAILAIPASLLFFGIGSALYSYYKTHPAQLDPTLTKTEALFPLFIVENLPAGVAGLLIAGVFAASMSSLDSAMNSVSAAVTTDFYRRFKKDVTEAACLRLARIVTVIIGLLGIGFALAMAHTDVKSLWDEFAFFLGLFGGGLAGVFLLAIFTRKSHGVGAAIGLVGSGCVQFFLKTTTDMNQWFFAFTGLGACLVIGYVASLIIPADKKDDDGLTIYTLKPAADAED
jgi:SSS family transporter